MPKGERLYTLRRGFLSAQIMCLAFSPNSTLLGVTSNRGTMHIFELERASHQSQKTGVPESEEENCEAEEESEPGCSACAGLQFLLEKLTGTICCVEAGGVHAGSRRAYRIL